MDILCVPTNENCMLRTSGSREYLCKKESTILKTGNRNENDLFCTIFRLKGKADYFCYLCHCTPYLNIWLTACIPIITSISLKVPITVLHVILIPNELNQIRNLSLLITK